MSYIHKSACLILFFMAFVPESYGRAKLKLPPPALTQQEVQRREDAAEAIEADDEDDSDEIALEIQKRQKPAIGMPNPASVNCIKSGGVIQEETKPNGNKFSVCQFSSGGKCEVWALLRRECRPGGIVVSDSDSPAARYCSIIGGHFTPGWAGADVASKEETGTCRLPKSGGTVNAQALWNGQQASQTP